MRVRPDAFHQLVLANKFPRSFHKRDQRVERPASETKRLIAFQQHALAGKKPKGAKDDSLLRGRQSTYPCSSHLAARPVLRSPHPGGQQDRSRYPAPGDGRRRRPVAALIGIDARLACALLFSLCAIQSGLNAIQEVALIERLGQIADDPSLKCAGTNIIARIGRYHDRGNLFAQSRQIVT
jgi:hypothetical protein